MQKTEFDPWVEKIPKNRKWQPIPWIVKSDMTKHAQMRSWPFVCLLWRKVYSNPLPIFFKLSFLFFLLSFRSSLYILDINPLSLIWFANTFFSFLACLFILLIISFAVQMLFSWCNPILLFLLLMLLALYLRNHCQSQSQEAFPLCFLHGVSLFQVLHLRLTLFELIFVCGIRVQINYFASRYPFFPTLFWRDSYFTICM